MLYSQSDFSTTTLRIVHHTHYAYAQPISLAHHMAMLEPLSDDRQQLLLFDWQVQATAESNASFSDARKISEHRALDRFRNAIRWFSIYHPHQALSVHTLSKVQLQRSDWPQAHQTVNCQQAAHKLHYRALHPWIPAQAFVGPSEYVPRLPEIKNWAAQSIHSHRPVLDAAIELMNRIFQEYTYSPQSTSIHTPLAKVWAQRAGVCQDFAHILIAALRSHGLAARYVSGYLLTHPPPGQARLTGADASHAWVQVWCPRLEGGGLWVDLDPTNNLLPADTHVRIAVGRDFGDVTPLKGVIRGGGHHTVKVAVTVEPWHEE
jgi:transglutaminase-like putative cysteine protease